MTLGQRIQEGRKALGLSQEGLGERLGVSRQAISKWEADGAVPEVDKLIALGRLFGVSLNGLLQVEGPDRAAEGEAEAALRRARRRKRAKNLGHILTGVLVLALLGGMAALWLRVDKLERALGEMATRPALSLEDRELVAEWDFSVQSQDDSGTVLSVRVTPAISVEGMEVSFQAVERNGEVYTADAARSEGAHYTAELTLPQYTAPTLSVVFALDGVQYVRALARFDRLTGTGASWEPLWEAK